MSKPIEWTDLIVPNGGIDETQSPQKIDPRKWAAAENVEALPDGVRRRLGTTAALSAALADTVTAVMDYRLSDGSTSRHLAFADGKLYKVIAGFTTQITGSYAGTMTDGDDMLPSWTVGNDRLFFTNNVEVAKKFYVLGGVEYFENEGIAAPTATATIAGAAGGSLGEHTYEIDWYYWNDDLGVASDRRYNGVSPLTVTLGAGEGTIQLASFPTVVARTGDRATHIRVEIRRTDNSTVFRYHSQITLGTTTLNITTDEVGTVEAEYEHAVAPVHEVKLVAENRQFILNLADAPYRLGYSAVIGTTSHYESFPATNTRDFGKGDGDYGTALAFMPPRLLIVGFKNSIYAIDARRPGTSDVTTISRNVGIANHRSVTVVGGKMFFVSDAAENKGMYMWTPGGEPQMLFGIDDTFKELNQNRIKYASCAHYAPGDNRFQWWTLLSGPGATQHDRIIVYDYGLGAWTIYTKPTGRELAVLGTIEASGIDKVYAGAYNGQEYLQDSGGDTDGGTSYDSKVTLKAEDHGAPQIIKQHRFVDYLAQGQSSGAMALSIERDYGQRGMLSRSLQQTTNSTPFTLGTDLLGGTKTMGGQGDILTRMSVRGRGKTFQPTVSGTTAWFLKGIAFGLQATGKK